MSEELKANADLTAIDSLLQGRDKADSAIVITINVFHRLMEQYPEHFSIKGTAIIYKGESHVYFHNRRDDEILVREANKSMEIQSL